MASTFRRAAPTFSDFRIFAIVAVAFGLAVFTISWHGRSLRLEVEAANLAWVVLVAFGMTWLGEVEASGRVALGLALGGLGVMAAYYGALVLVPITPFWIGSVLGLTALVMAFLSHAYPRVVSFSGTVVGFGVGLAAARSLPLRPTTRVDDLFALMLTVALGISMGLLGSMVLRFVVSRAEDRAEHTGARVIRMPHLHLPRRHAPAADGTAPVATRSRSAR
jgi:hypothetical protein